VDGNTKDDGIHSAAEHEGEAGNGRNSAYEDRSSSYRRFDFLTCSVHVFLLLLLLPLQNVACDPRGRISARAAYPARSAGQ